MKKWALITGATSDLGKELAIALAKQGYRLLLTAPNAKKLNIFSGENTLAADLTIKKERQKVIEWMRSYEVELIVNNAGAGLYGLALSHSIEEQLNLLTLNGEAALELCLAGAKNMIRPGIILNISSAAAFMPYPYFSVYSASKRFLLNFSQAFDVEMKKEGIRVLCACPGQIATSFRIKASKGRFNKITPMTLSITKVVAALLWQMQKQKPVHIIDWRYHLLILLQKWIPTPIKNFLLIKTIQKR